MPIRWEEEAPRLARLARLSLTDEETRALARACDAITHDFAALVDFARELPAAPDPAPGALRDDRVEPVSAEEVEAILRAAGKTDASRHVVVPRGLP